MESELKPDLELDVRGLTCPLPILRTKKAMAGMSSGQLIRVLATDAGAVQDFAAYCRHTGNALLRQQERDGVFEFILARK